EDLRVLRRVAWKWGSLDAEVFITRAGWIRDVLEALLGGPIRVASTSVLGSVRTKFRRMAAIADRLQFSTVRQQLSDRFDPRLVLRGAFCRTPEPSPRPFILLPSAYSNVSRAAVSYARMLPASDFLLVSTRENALIPDLPRNIRVVTLAAYAAEPSTNNECRQLLKKWAQVQRLLDAVPEFRLGVDSGIFNSIPWWIRTGLSIRNAWLNLFAHEPVQAVFCGDDSNPFTRMAALLSIRKGK